MTDVEHRVLRLERTRQVTSGGHAYGALIDSGPYDADELVGGWASDATFDTGDGVFHGREGIHRFFSDLAASYTIHYSSNTIVEFDEALKSASIRAYGLEMPVIANQALIGAFGHAGCTRWTGERWQAAERHQTMHFLSPVVTGWDDEHRITEQRISKREKAT